ncbi:MAG: hypothetical protein BGN96_06940 [Bacteroidales bacterium 45-6]|nr:MAG: hypothetical protein BGN96_06940 [Bacteroidales bacterium 45-6]
MSNQDFSLGLFSLRATAISYRQIKLRTYLAQTKLPGIFMFYGINTHVLTLPKASYSWGTRLHLGGGKVDRWGLNFKKSIFYRSNLVL